MTGASAYDWDVFISYASEDRDAVARPLASALQASSVTVWIDDQQLEVGDSLRRKIDQGLSRSRFGIVILSRHFFAKEWPQKELDALVAKEDGREKAILPVWYQVTKADVFSYSPMLADKKAVLVSEGMPKVLGEILRVVRPLGQVSDYQVKPLQQLLEAGYAWLVAVDDSLGNHVEDSIGTSEWKPWGTHLPAVVHVGQSVEFTATAACAASGGIQYKYSIQRSGQSFEVRRGWSDDRNWTWQVEWGDIGKGLCVMISARRVKNYYQFGAECDDYTYANYDVLPGTPKT
jgi:hypothetical protein